MTGVLITRGVWTQRCAQGLGSVKKHRSDSQGGAWTMSFPLSLRRKQPRWELDFGFSASGLRDRTFLWLKPPVCVPSLQSPKQANGHRDTRHSHWEHGGPVLEAGGSRPEPGLLCIQTGLFSSAFSIFSMRKLLSIEMRTPHLCIWTRCCLFDR